MQEIAQKCSKHYKSVLELQRQEEARKYAEEHPEEQQGKKGFLAAFGRKRKVKDAAETVEVVDTVVEETPAEEDAE